MINVSYKVSSMEPYRFLWMDLHTDQEMINRCMLRAKGMDFFPPDKPTTQLWVFKSFPEKEAQLTMEEFLLFFSAIVFPGSTWQTMLNKAEGNCAEQSSKL